MFQFNGKTANKEPHPCPLSLKGEGNESGIELIQTGKARPPVDADSDSFILPGISSAASNMKGYAKNLGSNFLDLFRKNKKAERHKDFMKKSRKDEISARADAEMANMMDTSAAEEERKMDILNGLYKPIRDEDNEVYD